MPSSLSPEGAAFKQFTEEIKSLAIEINRAREAMERNKKPGGKYITLGKISDGDTSFKIHKAAIEALKKRWCGRVVDRHHITNIDIELKRTPLCEMADSEREGIEEQRENEESRPGYPQGPPQPIAAVVVRGFISVDGGTTPIDYSSKSSSSRT